MSAVEYTYWQQYLDIDGRVRERMSKRRGESYGNALDYVKAEYNLYLKIEAKKRG